MKLLTLSAFALLAAVTTMHLPSTDGPVGTTGIPLLQGPHSAADVNKLPTQGVEDQSLVYSIGTKH
jgi:hypothetical protein